MEIAKYYIEMGFTHVLPYGADHILFILCLFLLAIDLKSLLVQCTLFTLAHSITLLLVALGIVSPPAQWVEVLIAVSILYAAIENIVSTKASKWRYIVVFVFGLIHGMGFAEVLQRAGISQDQLITAILSFNLGVELAQVAVVLLAYFSLGYLFSINTTYKIRMVQFGSSLIACVALYWIVERMFFY